MHTLKERLELEKRNRKPEEIIDLNLDNSKATDIEGLTDEYINLEGLSLIHVGLQSLKNLPKLPALKKLELSDNNISSGLDILGENAPEIEQLVLTNNKIKDLETLKPLAKLKKLTSLDLFSCAVTKTETFREDVFNLLPQLKYLDGFDIDNREEPDEEYEEEDEEEDEEYQEDDDDDDDASDEEEEEIEDDEEDSEYDEEEEQDADVASNQSDSNNKLLSSTNVSGVGDNSASAAGPHPAGKVGMNNHHHHPVVSSSIPAVVDPDDEYSEEEEEDDEEFEESLGEEDEITETSAARGTKRKYSAAVVDEEAAGDSATNE